MMVEENGVRTALKNQRIQHQYTLRSSGGVKQITMIQGGASPAQNWSRRRRGRAAVTGSVPVYIRAVSNVGFRPKNSASAIPSRFTAGMSRIISQQLALASKACTIASAAARSSATSGPILCPVRHGRIHAPCGELAIAQQRAAKMAGRVLIQARRKAAACRRENGGVVGFHHREWNLVERDDIGWRRGGATTTPP